MTERGHVAAVHKLLAPIVPTNLMCIGLNYRHHAEESNVAVPQFPILFMKSTGSLQNPGDPIVLPRKLRSDELFLRPRPFRASYFDVVVTMVLTPATELAERWNG